MNSTLRNTCFKSLAELHPDPRNARVHSKHQIRQIARSIQSFGFNVPVLIDGANQILAGHGRVEAAKSLGLTQIPVITLDHLTTEEARAFAIADNRLTENATWNEALLGEIFSELNNLDLSFSLEDTGFSMSEIDLRIADFENPNAASLEDELPPPPKQVVSQLGDLWLLGKHRILCGSALEETSFERLMIGKRADLIFTDPPFNVPIEGHVSGRRNSKAKQDRPKHAEFAMASGEMSSSEFTHFLKRSLGLLAANSKSGSIHYVCMDWRHLPEVQTAGASVYTELKNLCVWVKDKGGMGSLYRSQHELILVFKNGKGSHRNNVELGKHGRYRTNVWQYAGANTLSRQGHEGDLLAMHPTVKPMNLVADAILDCSARGEILLDGFLGSGTTLLASERTGRICYGIELSPAYVDLAITRWQAMTGEHAIHAASNQSFDERLHGAASSKALEASHV
ncbi:DNA methyltransferase [Polynucleobacter sp. AP-Nino-20-G2]|uniref:site-specific DNA-methyltransferase n=1 Tax=Polynucleobacter sp. AP-Nino-20-G2 TaxID=2576917 RepID=UPI001BFD79F3|nr:DNA methyltransferase [Polynucleobacter sp. AP-Nino-20-G2]QWE17158.1 ParB N-terminal domain-containing protein [Polynucleobacter sp. AP-Nino-20-G2]